MAINKTKNTVYGVDVTHHVIERIEIIRALNLLKFRINEFPSDNHYNTGNTALITEEYSFNFTVLPELVLTKMQELKEAIEIEMINNLPEWQDGTQVQDDGSPMV